MNKYLLIPTVWALLATSHIRAQQHLTGINGSSMPLSSKSLLIPIGLHPSTTNQSLIIDKKHRQQTSITGFSENGDTLFSSGYKRGKLHGAWMSWYHPGQLCDSGRLERNIPDGEWKSWYNNGQPRSLRTYSAFMLHRIKDEIPRRQAKVTFFAITDIAKTDLSYAYQLLTPIYSYLTLAVNAADPQTIAPRSLEDRVERNMLQGLQPYLPPFTECLHHGLYINYYPDGNIKDSGLYNNGLREGVWDEWINNGALRTTGAYNRGRKQDTWKYYTSSGRLIGVKTYNKQGKEIARKKFNSNEESNNQ
jgi:antitoxin component YwqK of YwqJK toxin-antitoxin module